MERFEEALKGLDITDQRTKEKVAPLRQRFLVASQRLQRPLTPLNASVHAAASRAVTKRGSPSTSLYWVSVYDRVGLFDVDDCHVARLIDAALRSAALSSAKSMIAALGASSNPAALSCMIGLKKLATALASGRAAALATTLAAAAGMALEITLTRAVLVTQPSVQTVEMGVVVDVLTAVLALLTALLAVLTAAPEMLRAAMLAGMLRPLQAASMTAVLAVSTAALEVLPAALVVLTLPQA
eukprot:contig_32143_g7824